MPLVVYLYFSISKPFEIYTQGQDYKGRPSSISDFTTFEVMPLNLAKKNYFPDFFSMALVVPFCSL
jgi:hypothetical protein